MTEFLSDAELARCVELAEAATPGPWEIIGGGEYVTGIGVPVAPDDGGSSAADAEFIAFARDALPRALAELRALRGQIADVQAAQDADLRAERDAAREALARAHQTREAGVTAATEIARLRAFLDAVRALHQPLDAINVDAPAGRQRTRVCAVCAGRSGPWAVWPCATIQAIEGDQT